MPFLPGDSLLFAAGAMAARYPDDLHVGLVLVLLSVAAIIGDTINYALGRWIGPRAFTIDRWFLKHEHLQRTQAFYERHGGKTIVLARFVPIVRTFITAVAGVARMDFRKYALYSTIGALLWAVGVTVLGYFLGNVPWVAKNVELVLVLIVLISLLPMVVEYVRHRRSSAA
jgi:membrane-associated protein